MRFCWLPCPVQELTRLKCELGQQHVAAEEARHARQLLQAQLDEAQASVRQLLGVVGQSSASAAKGVSRRACMHASNTRRCAPDDQSIVPLLRATHACAIAACCLQEREHVVSELVRCMEQRTVERDEAVAAAAAAKASAEQHVTRAEAEAAKQRRQLQQALDDAQAECATAEAGLKRALAEAAEAASKGRTLRRLGDMHLVAHCVRACRPVAACMCAQVPLAAVLACCTQVLLMQRRPRRRGSSSGCRRRRPSWQSP